MCGKWNWKKYGSAPSYCTYFFTLDYYSDTEVDEMSASFFYI